MRKTKIKFRTKVLSEASKQQIYAFYDKKHSTIKLPQKSVLYGNEFGTLNFWR